MVNLIISRGKYKAYFVHRLVALAFIPNPDNLPQVNHIDENKSNNYVYNLEWCTPKHNARHFIKLHPNFLSIRQQGELSSNHKLTDKDVIEIYNLLKDNKLTQKEIALKFNIHKVVISAIRYGRSWSHVTDKLGGPIHKCQKIKSNNITKIDSLDNWF